MDTTPAAQTARRHVRTCLLHYRQAIHIAAMLTPLEFLIGISPVAAALGAFMWFHHTGRLEVWMDESNARYKLRVRKLRAARKTARQQAARHRASRRPASNAGQEADR